MAGTLEDGQGVSGPPLQVGLHPGGPVEPVELGHS